MDTTKDASPAPELSQAVTPYARWADIFARAYADTHSITLALEILDTIREGERTGQPPSASDLDRVLAVAASLFDVPVERLRERNHRPDVTAARYVAAYLLRRRHQHWSTTKLGELFGLDHSTIVSGLQKVANSRHLLLAASKAEQILAFEAQGTSCLRAA